MKLRSSSNQTRSEYLEIALPVSALPNRAEITPRPISAQIAVPELCWQDCNRGPRLCTAEHSDELKSLPHSPAQLSTIEQASGQLN